MRGRPRKKESDPQKEMERLLYRAASAWKADGDGASLRSIARELGTSVLRVRKLLITEGLFSTEVSREVQRRAERNEPIGQIAGEMKLSRASVYSYLPYSGRAFNLQESTVNADRHRLQRRRARAVRELTACRQGAQELDKLWNCVCAFEAYPFTMSGGERFSYRISGSGIRVLPQGTVLTRHEIERGYQRTLEMEKEGGAEGPEKIGKGPGAEVLFAMLTRFGLTGE